MSATTSHVVPLPRLKDLVNLILDHIIRDLGIESVEITPDEDFYWDMDKRYLYNVQNKEPVLDIGRLADDWEFLSKMERREEAVALMMIHAAPLLRYIGEKIGQ